jgi:Rps23 Pro-64 3,4-dihydroxylase Tpa1-like proline 4-hydroxylase
MPQGDRSTQAMRATVGEKEKGRPLREPYLVVDDFLPGEIAAAMRRDIESHFAEPGRHRAESHQIWNYWYVPELYTYFRTAPEKIIAAAHVHLFMEALKSWTVETLGMGFVTWPYLSLYVSGCKQGIHNDSTNGRFAFVYSLTKNERRTSGGQTIVLHEGDHFRGKLTLPTAGRGFYDLIEPAFNRLCIFDDRMPHAVERVDGSMDPVEGRFVFHGHISESGPIVNGALPAAAINEVVQSVVTQFVTETADRPGSYHGPLVLRFTIAPSGAVAESRIVVDRVARADGAGAEPASVVEDVLARLTALKFPAALQKTELTLPILIGGPLPWMRQ